MQKIVLSVFVVVASGLYVWHEAVSGSDASSVLGLDIPPSVSALAPASAPQPAVLLEASVPILSADREDNAETAQAAESTFEVEADDDEDDLAPLLTLATPGVEESAVVAEAIAASPAPMDVPLPHLRPLPQPIDRSRFAGAFRSLSGSVAVAAVQPANYRDGTYTGPRADAFYGIVRVQAVVESGKIVRIVVLEYPDDRRVSRRINDRALPVLRNEAISAQSERVDIVTGATLTSRAFADSLAEALAQSHA